MPVETFHVSGGTAPSVTSYNIHFVWPPALKASLDLPVVNLKTVSTGATIYQGDVYAERYYAVGEYRWYPVGVYGTVDGMSTRVARASRDQTSTPYADFQILPSYVFRQNEDRKGYAYGSPAFDGSGATSQWFPDSSSFVNPASGSHFAGGSIYEYQDVSGGPIRYTSLVSQATAGKKWKFVGYRQYDTDYNLPKLSATVTRYRDGHASNFNIIEDDSAFSFDYGTSVNGNFMQSGALVFADLSGGNTRIATSQSQGTGCLRVGAIVAVDSYATSGSKLKLAPLVFNPYDEATKQRILRRSRDYNTMNNTHSYDVDGYIWNGTIGSFSQRWFGGQRIRVAECVRDIWPDTGLAKTVDIVYIGYFENSLGHAGSVQAYDSELPAPWDDTVVIHGKGFPYLAKKTNPSSAPYTSYVLTNRKEGYAEGFVTGGFNNAYGNFQEDNDRMSRTQPVASTMREMVGGTPYTMGPWIHFSVPTRAEYLYPVKLELHSLWRSRDGVSVCYPRFLYARWAKYSHVDNLWHCLGDDWQAVTRTTKTRTISYEYCYCDDYNESGCIHTTCETFSYDEMGADYALSFAVPDTTCGEVGKWAIAIWGDWAYCENSQGTTPPTDESIAVDSGVFLAGPGQQVQCGNATDSIVGYLLDDGARNHAVYPFDIFKFDPTAGVDTRPCPYVGWYNGCQSSFSLPALSGSTMPVVTFNSVAKNIELQNLYAYSTNSDEYVTDLGKSREPLVHLKIYRTDEPYTLRSDSHGTYWEYAEQGIPKYALRTVPYDFGFTVPGISAAQPIGNPFGVPIPIRVDVMQTEYYLNSYNTIGQALWEESVNPGRVMGITQTSHLLTIPPY